MKRAAIAGYRVRGPIYFVAAAILIANLLLGDLVEGEVAGSVRTALVLLALAAVVLCIVLMLLGPQLLPNHGARSVVPPVRGRWLAVNSPASKVPSHGVRAYGQAYAIDLVHEPTDRPRPSFGRGPAMRAAQQYPAFGQEVLAMIDGTVVTASGWRRDHRARSNLLGLGYLLVEGAIREVGGAGFLLGNHVTIRGDDGVCATVAHLQRGSVTVRPGDRVAAGARIGRCGNSGNSSEPHVHAQLMDRPSVWTGQGLPLAFSGITLGTGTERVDAVPENQQHMTAGGLDREPV